MKISRITIVGKHVTSFNLDRKYEQWVFEVLRILEKKSGYPKTEVKVDS